MAILGSRPLIDSISLLEQIGVILVDGQNRE
jgi:hypothetical protein